MDGDAVANPLPQLTRSISHLSLDEDVSWFHGKITRDAAEQLLTAGDKQDGYFLVRESVSSPGDLVLSLIYNEIPIHYQIRRHSEDAFFSIDDGPIVHGLEMLISYYQDDAQGLSTKLGQMCKGQPPPPDTRRHGRTNLLHRATREDNLTVVRELLKSGYHNLDAKNQEGQTAVHLASMYGYDDILDLLLEAGANPNIKDGSGISPLTYAAQNNRQTTVKILLKYGANPQLRTPLGWVPLHEAASRGFIEVAKILLENKAPCHSRSNFNQTPLDIALSTNNSEIAALLENYVAPAPESTRVDWFHETVDREKAAELLQESGLEDGTFLVRRSSRKADTYVLSMACNAHVYNYEIQRKDKFYFIDDGPYLESLDRIVEHYSLMADGLPTNLVKPIKPEFPCKSTHSIREEEESVATNYDNMQPNRDFEKSQPKPITAQEANGDRPVKYRRPNLIRKDSLRIGQSVGEGEFGSVLKGKWLNNKNSQVDVAIKTLRDEHIPSSREEFIREVEVMVGLNHHCIVKLLGICLGPPLMMVQELVPLGSVLDYLLTFPEQISPQFEMLLWSAQIAWGMMYLESKRFVHRDLAARNILLASKYHAKISDFGLSRALSGESQYYKARTGGKWPVKWYAPESINFGTFSHASDVWSYGVTLWELFTYGDQPYGEMTGSQVIKLLESNQRLTIPKVCSSKMYALLSQCWEYEPQRRPTFSQIYHTFCTDSEYSDIWNQLKINV